MSKNITVRIGFGSKSFIWCVVSLLTAIIGHEIHGSTFWAVMDFFFMPLAWLKWVICQEVNISIIKESFAWFFQ